MSLSAAAVALMIGSAVPQVVETRDGARLLVLAADPAMATPAGAVSLEPGLEVGLDSAPQAANENEADPVSDPAAPSDPQVDAAAEQGAAEAEAGDDAGDENIIIIQRRRPIEGDPLERLNEVSFDVVQGIDGAVLTPAADAYNKGLPRPVRNGLRNFFSNLNEPVVFLAYLLELKPGKAFETAGRFLINSTVGVAGLIDVAKREPFNLPFRPNGMANVLGYYGVKPGAYMYLPIIGPTTVRDLIGDSIDRLASPALLGKPFTDPEVFVPMIVFNQLGERAAFQEEIGKIREAEDPYAFYRTLYLRQREAEIEALHGRVVSDVVPVYGRTMPTAGTPKADDDAVPGEARPETAPAPSDEPAPAVPAPEAAGEAPSASVDVAEPVRAEVAAEQP